MFAENQVQTYSDESKGYSGLAQQEQVAEPLPIMREYGTLNRYISNLAEEVALLEQRLLPVLSPERISKEGAGDAVAPREQLSPFAEGIRSDADNLAGILRRLSTIRNRVELTS